MSVENPVESVWERGENPRGRVEETFNMAADVERC